MFANSGAPTRLGADRNHPCSLRDDGGGLRDESRCFSALTGGKGAPPRLHIPDSPPRVPRRAPSKGNKRETLSDIARRVPVEVIRPYFNYPLRKAAEALSISVTTLKRLCRRHGVKRWPHRQLSGLNRAVAHLESKRQAAGDDGRDQVVAEQLRQLYSRRDSIIEHAFMHENDNNAESGLNSEANLIVESTVESPGGCGQGCSSPTSDGSSDYSDSPINLLTPWWQREAGTGSWPPLHVASVSPSGRGNGQPSDGFNTSLPNESPSNSWHESGDLDLGRGSRSRFLGSEGDGDDGGGIDLRCNLPRTDSGGSNNSSCFRASSVLVRLPTLASTPQRTDGLPSPSKNATTRALLSSSTAPPSPASPCKNDTLQILLTPTSSDRFSGFRSPKQQKTKVFSTETRDKKIADMISLNELLFGPDADEPSAIPPSPPSCKATNSSHQKEASSRGDGAGNSSRSCRCTCGAGASPGDTPGSLPPIAGLVSAGNVMCGSDQW